MIDVLEELNEVKDMTSIKLKDAEEVLSALLAQLSSLTDDVEDSAVMMIQEQQR